MGNNNEGKSSKSEKSSSPAPTDQTNIHIYPNWAAMQAYYGPRVTMPPYYNSTMAYGHAPPPYMWSPPQPMMPPYGSPYATIYSHGGFYAHHAVPLAEVSAETPSKSSGNAEQGSRKKLKGLDGLAMSIGNGTAENAEGGTEPRLSQSAGTEGSTDGSDGNTTGMGQTTQKRSGAGTATIALEVRNPPTMNAKYSPTSMPRGVIPSEDQLRNGRELKRERRKQSNRESARRSRLRKQAETEEVVRVVESLTAENATLRSEINKLSEKSEKLRLENAALVEELKNAELGQTQEKTNNKEEKEAFFVKQEGLKNAELAQAQKNTKEEKVDETYDSRNFDNIINRIQDLLQENF